MDRRKFLRRAALAAVGAATAGGAYPFLEARWCRVVRRTIALPNLPGPFRGTTVALLADVHHGPYVPRSYIRDVVAMTNALEPDIVALAGDFVDRSADCIAPVIAGLTHQKPREFGPIHSINSRSSTRPGGGGWRYSSPCCASPP